MERTDRDFADKEHEILSIYCFEIEIEEIRYSVNSFNLDSLLETIKNKESQRMIILEIISLVYSDNILHKEKEKILNCMIDIFGLEKKYKSYLERGLKQCWL